MLAKMLENYKNEQQLAGNRFRHEMKYVCTNAQKVLIESHIKGIVQLDSNAKKSQEYNGYYNIRSLYFDDIYNSCYYENENGTDMREKFRIRIYNNCKDRILLENKKKIRGKTQKLSCELTEEQCNRLIEGKEIPFDNKTPDLLRKLLLQRKTKLLKPVVIVDYDRIPYVNPNGNVRITFDLNISSSQRLENFLGGDIGKRPIMPANEHILEVKWDNYIPDYIHHSLQIGELRQTAFSKYYLCRRFSMHK